MGGGGGVRGMRWGEGNGKEGEGNGREGEGNGGEGERGKGGEGGGGRGGASTFYCTWTMASSNVHKDYGFYQ